MLDEQKWLAPFDGENPSGKSLRDENIFSELIRAATPIFKVEEDANGKPIQRKPIDRIADPIDWGTVLDKADQLSQIGRDIRLLTIICRAQAGQEGLAGAKTGIDLITTSLDQFWDSLHPQIRDGGNSTRRINALLALEDDEAGLFGDLMRLQIVDIRGIGAVTLAQAAQASIDEDQFVHEAPSGFSDKEKADLKQRHIEIVKKVNLALQALAEQDPDAHSALKADLEAMAASVLALEAKVEEKMKAPKLRLPNLKACFQDALVTLEAAKTPAQSKEDEPIEEIPQTVTSITDDGPKKAAIEVKGAGGNVIPNQLNSRDDVQKCLQLIIDFYNQTEPSSPIPLLATRMKKMVPMDFMELMQELAPSGLKEFNNVAGKAVDKK